MQTWRMSDLRYPKHKVFIRRGHGYLVGTCCRTEFWWLVNDGILWSMTGCIFMKPLLKLRVFSLLRRVSLSDQLHTGLIFHPETIMNYELIACIFLGSHHSYTVVVVRVNQNLLGVNSILFGDYFPTSMSFHPIFPLKLAIGTNTMRRACTCLYSLCLSWSRTFFCFGFSTCWVPHPMLQP